MLRISLGLLFLVSIVLLRIEFYDSKIYEPCPEVDTMAILNMYPCYPDTIFIEDQSSWNLGFSTKIGTDKKVSAIPTFGYRDKKQNFYYVYYDPIRKTGGAGAFFVIKSKY